LDADGDGDTDIYELTSLGNRFLAWNGSSFAVATLPTGLLTSLNPALFRIVPADYNNDGDMDFLYQTSNGSGTGIGYLQNNLNGTFTNTNAPAGNFTGSNSPFGTASFTFISRAALNQEQIIIDLDSDGDKDIFQLSTTSSSALLQTGIGLPVKLEEYKVAKRQTDVVVNWKTSGEMDVKYFSVEYSLDGIQFVSLKNMESKGKGGNGAEYKFIHTTPVKGIQYYRLVEYNLDGSKTYFSTRSVSFDGILNLVQVLPNRVHDKVTAYVVQGLYQQVQLMDNTGRTLYVKDLSSQSTELNLGMKSYAAGIYYLRFIGKNTVITKRFVKE